MSTGLKIRQSDKYVSDDWWSWSVWLEGATEDLDKVEYVDWILHPTFPNPVRRKTDRKNNFRLKTGGWGEFQIVSQVQFRDGRKETIRHQLRLHRRVAAHSDSSASEAAGEQSTDVVNTEFRSPRIRRLIQELEVALTDGDLKDSELGGAVLETLKDEWEVKLSNTFDWRLIIDGIRAADDCFPLIGTSDTQPVLQKDFGRCATPILIAVARSLKPSAEARAVVVRLCDTIARRLRLKLTWPQDTYESTKLKTRIYRACLKSRELLSDDVLAKLQSPKLGLVMQRAS